MAPGICISFYAHHSAFLSMRTILLSDGAIGAELPGIEGSTEICHALGRFSVFEARKPCVVASLSHI